MKPSKKMKKSGKNILQLIALRPGAAQSLLFFLMFIGGSSGSTAGGIKVVRWTVLFKQATNEIKKMLHPHGVYTIRLNQKVRFARAIGSIC